MDVTTPGSSTSKGQVTSEFDATLPTAAILCIAIAVYLILMVVALFLRWYIKTHNLFNNSCCGKDGNCNLCECSCDSCCAQNCCSSFDSSKWKALLCCSTCAGCCDTRDCCFGGCGTGCLPDCGCSGKCLDGCCSCERCNLDICCCGAEDHLCQSDKCDCSCRCQLPECQAINCCCFEIRIKS